jgi:hypothetical protein
MLVAVGLLIHPTTHPTPDPTGLRNATQSPNYPTIAPNRWDNDELRYINDI